MPRSMEHCAGSMKKVSSSIRFVTKRERLPRDWPVNNPVRPDHSCRRLMWFAAPPTGTTPPTFPGGDPVPTVGNQRRTGPFGLPMPDEIARRRREEERDREDASEVAVRRVTIRDCRRTLTRATDVRQTFPDRRYHPPLPPEEIRGRTIRSRECWTLPT